MSENDENAPAVASEATGGDEPATTADADAATTADADGGAPQEEAAAPPPESTEEITYHAVEKDGQVTAIWEMQGRKHLRTIDPRSRQGAEILRLYTAEHPE